MALRSALLLEDEPIVGFALEDMLLELGFEEAELATTIQQAFEYLESRHPDVAILDVNIHGERSYAVATALKQSGIPFVFATGYGDAEHPQSLREVPTLTKPYSLNDLRNVLAAILSRPGLQG